MDWIRILIRCFQADAVLYTSHARREMQNEPFGAISEQEVYEAVLSGEVIEEYPDDTPYPSVLLYGRTHANRPLHIVCAYNAEENLAIIITVYHPDPGRWIDYRRRR